MRIGLLYTGQKNCVDAFGYNSAESKPIWMKLEHSEPILELALEDFGRDSRSSDSLRGSRNFVFVR